MHGLARRAAHAAVFGVVVTFIACSDSTVSAPDQPRVQMAPGGGGKTTSTATAVTSTDPSWAHPGDTNKQVTINGSGFESGAEVAWQRGGVADSRIAVKAVQFVSAKRLIATVDVAADAEIAFYDVAVINPSKKQGIGTELFEVTTATPIGGWLARGTNDSGFAVAGSIIYTPAAGTVELGEGNAWGVDQSGSILAGTHNEVAKVWPFDGTTRGPGIALPVGAAANASMAITISPNGQFVGGKENPPVKKGARNIGTIPVVWAFDGSSWQRHALPLPAGALSSVVREVNDNGVAVGATTEYYNQKQTGQGVVWQRDGGSWVVAFVGPVGSALDGINTAGDFIVGLVNGGDASGGNAAYWRKVDGHWRGPFILPDCSFAKGVSDNGVIVAKGCSNKQGDHVTAAVFAGDYTSALYLSGFGKKGTRTDAEEISRNGLVVVGGNEGGALWQLY